MLLDPLNIETFYPLIYSIVGQTCRKNRLLDKDDFIQEAILALIENWNRHGYELAPDSHYYRIIRFSIIQTYRRIGLTTRCLNPEPLDMLPLDTIDEELGVESTYEEDILAKELFEFIDKLSAKDKRLFLLLLADTPQHSIAMELKCTDGYISQQRKRGIEKLRVAMEG